MSGLLGLLVEWPAGLIGSLVAGLYELFASILALIAGAAVYVSVADKVLGGWPVMARRIGAAIPALFLGLWLGLILFRSKHHLAMSLLSSMAN